MYTLWLTNHTYPKASKSIKFKSLKKLFNLSSKKYATPKLEIEKLLTNDFGKDALNILTGAQFTPALINGKRSPIKMELPLKFKLEDL